MDMSFFIPGPPPRTTAQTRQAVVVNGRPRFYKPLKLRQAEAQLRKGLEPYRPPEPLHGPLELAVEWRFQAPKGMKLQPGMNWKITRPDTDNLEKLLKDVMTDLGFWQDDAQVACERVNKRWTLNPGIYVYVNQLES